ncbi:MAG: hypothetical protein MH219_10950, partial [Marinobacter sp.]|nr:hypothetical protein [Marinobacter sp.]
GFYLTYLKTVTCDLFWLGSVPFLWPDFEHDGCVLWLNQWVFGVVSFSAVFPSTETGNGATGESPESNAQGAVLLVWH